MMADHLSNTGFDIEPTGIIIILRCASDANAFVSIYPQRRSGREPGHVYDTAMVSQSPNNDHREYDSDSRISRGLATRPSVV